MLSLLLLLFLHSAVQKKRGKPGMCQCFSVLHILLCFDLFSVSFILDDPCISLVIVKLVVLIRKLNIRVFCL